MSAVVEKTNTAAPVVEQVIEEVVAAEEVAVEAAEPVVETAEEVDAALEEVAEEGDDEVIHSDEAVSGDEAMTAENEDLKVAQEKTEVAEEEEKKDEDVVMEETNAVGADDEEPQAAEVNATAEAKLIEEAAKADVDFPVDIDSMASLEKALEDGKAVAEVLKKNVAMLTSDAALNMENADMTNIARDIATEMLEEMYRLSEVINIHSSLLENELGLECELDEELYNDLMIDDEEITEESGEFTLDESETSKSLTPTEACGVIDAANNFVRQKKVIDALLENVVQNKKDSKKASKKTESKKAPAKKTESKKAVKKAEKAVKKAVKKTDAKKAPAKKISSPMKKAVVAPAAMKKISSPMKKAASAPKKAASAMKKAPVMKKQVMKKK